MVSVIAYVVAWFMAALDITQFAVQVRMRSISQLINSISRVLQKLPEYFNGNIIWRAFAPSFPVEPVIFCLILNEGLLPGKSTGVLASFKAGSSLLYYYKMPDVFE